MAIGATAVALTHATNDTYIAFLNPLLPRIMGELGLSITLAAALAMILSIASSLVQPGMGYLADRYGRRRFAIAGPMVTVVFMSLMGLAPSFAILTALLVAGGIGSAAFHPPGASMAARAAEGKGSGLRLSIFSFGGATGSAIGPILAVLIVQRVGLRGLWVALVPGVLILMAVAPFLPGPPPNAKAVLPPRPRQLLARLRGPLGLLFGISAVGAFIQRVFVTMEPIIVASAGGSEATGAYALSVYLGAQAVGTLVGGVLTDRVDRRALLIGLTLATTPMHFLAVALPPGSPLALLCALAAGFLNMALVPPIVVMAQEMIPEGAAVSSGIVMGLAWAAGSVAVLGTGVLGDVIGPMGAAALSMPLGLIGTALALHPALKAHGRPRVHGPA